MLAKIPDNINLNCSIFNSYDYNDLSLTELLCTFFNKINECIDISNKSLTFLEWLKEIGLHEETIKILNEWLIDGTLTEIINEEIFNELNAKINTINQKVSDIENVTIPPIKNDVEILKSMLVNVRYFGATGDGVTDDTEAIKKALNSLGTMWTTKANILYFPSGNYKITQPLNIDKNGVQIMGNGVDSTIISPSGSFNGINLIGTRDNTRFSVRLSNFTLYGKELNGYGVNWSYAGLHCGIENVNIESVNGVGLYISSSFDHILNNIEIRDCKGKGVYINEKKSPFEEISYISFNNVVSVANDNNGVQWEINGGNNLYINDCKANEGTIGIKFSGETWNVIINNFYMDGLANGVSDVFIIDNFNTSRMSISNVYAWRCRDIVVLMSAKSVSLTNLGRNPYNSEGVQRNDILIDKNFHGNLYVDNIPYTIDNKSQREINFEISSTKPNQTIDTFELSGNFLSGYNSLDIEYSSSKTFSGVVATLKGDNKISTENGKVIPSIDVDFSGGYFRVKLSLTDGITANAAKDVKVQVMVMYKY